MSRLAGTFSVLIDPARVFPRLLAEPRSLLVLFLLVASSLGAHAAQCARLDESAMIRATAAQMAADKGERDIAEGEVRKEAIRRMNMKRIFGYGAALAVVPLSVLLTALAFLLLGRMAGRKLSLKSANCLAGHLWLPLAVRNLMAVPVILHYPGIDPLQSQGVFRTNLAALMGSGETLPGLFLVDPIWIWMAVLFFSAGRAAGWGKAWAGAGGVLLWLALGFAGRGLS